MAFIVNATFDAATSGEATATTTGAASHSGTAAGRTHSTAQKISGASLYCSALSYLQWTFGAGLPDVFTRLYVFRQTVPSGTAYFAEWTSGGVGTGGTGLGFDSSGGLVVRAGASVQQTYPVNTGQWYRVDWTVDPSFAQRVRLYTGATLHSANTADAVQGGGLITVNAIQPTTLHIGMISNVGAWYVDEIGADDSVLPVPWTPPPPPTGRRVERKVSGAWVPQVLEKKVGGAWVPQIIERKDAGVWS